MSIEFGINNAPPSQEQIDGAVAALKAKRRVQVGVGWGMIVLFTLFVSVAMTSGAKTLGLGFMVLAILSTASMSWLIATSVTPFQLSALEPMPENLCASMLLICTDFAPAARYRDAVLSHGRKFVRAEYDMLAEARSEKSSAVSCKLLYGVPA